MSEFERIPLFPLELTALPGQLVTLHIFEERYKQLIALCTAEGVGSNAKPFGIARLDGENLSTYGCSMRINEVQPSMADGSFDVVVRGEKRFRIEKLHQDRPYFEGDVEYVDDESSKVEPELRTKLIERHRELSLLSGIPYALFEKAQNLSFASALSAGLDDSLRQQLLLLRAETDRLVWLAEVYEGACEQLKKHELERFASAKRKRGGGVIATPGAGVEYIH